MPKVGVFTACYNDQFYPQVGIAALEVLGQYGCDVSFPLNQTCRKGNSYCRDTK